VCVLTPPSARRFTDPAALERQTGHPVRSEYKNPGEPDVLPDPDAVIVAPATVNTINKWAAGICDTLALGILVEAIGKRLPIVALPSTNHAHAAHPAFTENLGKLRSWGVSVLFGLGIDGHGGRNAQPTDASSPGPATRSGAAMPEGSPRTVLVTGGGTGIGRAIATAFAGQGDRVTITGRRAAPLEEAAASLGAAWVAFDASDPAAVCAALDQLPQTVAVLVNNAGGNTDFDRAAPDANDLAGLAAAWQANLDANLLSAVLMTAALTPRLEPDGRIVTLGSIAARRGAGSYGAAKAAVEAWTADVAAELGPRGITANVVSPGVTLGSEFFRGRLTDERARRLVAETKTGAREILPTWPRR
jgi:3-oxoacyl-[acyl-carrier protein] reductase